ncbi:MAG: hypothetical protein II919_00695 [Lachnospiraceae bacterium]|nr:hypothetical protein [Lachnospiraceae bacterium]
METKNSKYLDLITYVVCFALVIATPYLARPTAPLFDWVGYGAMRNFFYELFTGIYWVIEIILMAVFYKKKLKKTILSNPETKGQELPYKRIAVISVVVAVCILVISAQIRFNVKPFYDLGEKFNGYELMNHIGIFIRNIVKCVWIVIMAKAMQSFFEQIGTGKINQLPYAGFVLMMTLGIYDFIIGANSLAVTYLFLYVIYGWLYLLTDRSMMKTYLLVMFIFLF